MLIYVTCSNSKYNVPLKDFRVNMIITIIVNDSLIAQNLYSFWKRLGSVDSP